MIPKIIHYCWFGGHPLPADAKNYIESWKRFFPDYEIKEWNETNYDVHKITYISQAYNAKKYAFVSDYARFDILYHEGGIYFDTDVEVVKSFDDILSHGAFMGCERDGKRIEELEKNKEKIEDTNLAINPGLGIAVAPGLGIAVAPGLGIYKELLDLYADLSFLNSNGTFNTKTIVQYTTELLVKKGLKDINTIQQVEGITIYPKCYFNPYDWATGEIVVTPETYSIHHYAGSWTTKRNKFNKKIANTFNKIKRIGRRLFLE